ncbi:MAG: helix-turn-helix domain-containing protein [Actinobacteria bacterium]|nr:helix-turn-helix domain-containing protein [Actinomycetota bacterium]
MYISIRRAVEESSVSQATLNRWIERGDLAVVKVGGRILIDTADLRAFLDAHKETRRPKPLPSAEEPGDAA